MKKQILCFLLCLVLTLSLLPVTAQAATTIEKVTLSIAYPEAGKVPPTAAWHDRGYTVYDTEWYDRNKDRYLEEGDKIQAGHQYTATIWVEASDGYAFKAADDNTPSITATVNGESISAQKAYEYKAWAMVTVTYDFSPIPPKGWIDTAKVTVPAPVAGQAPSYTQLREEKFHSSNVYFSGKTDENMKNGISWFTGSFDELSPENAVFAEQTVYGFHTLLFPEEGYSFHDNTKVYVNGKLAEAIWDYATFMSVTYKFPATGKLEVTESHTHSPSDWRTTQVYHYKVCTTCGDMLGEEDHKGGKATCAEKGRCTVCNYAYLPENEDHTPDSKWIACGGLYHAKLCKLCGAHCTPEDHKPGPAATDTAAQTCTVCEYIITPAKNHKHDLTRVPQIPADCTNGGNMEYYFCVGCNDCFTDAEAKNKIPETMSVLVGAMGHTTSDHWNNDGQYHWRICTTCKVVLDETKMLHDTAEGNCATCGYVLESGETSPGTTASENESGDPTEAAPRPVVSKKSEKDSWITILLVALVCFGAAITATVIILKMKKKRENSNEENP